MKTTTREQREIGRPLAPAVFSLILTFALILIPPDRASATPCGSWTVVPSANPSSSSNYLDDVAAVAPSQLWAVGRYRAPSAGMTLVERSNGVIWKQWPSPSPGGWNNLSGVAISSPTDAWAVGDYSPGTSASALTLTEHWNGTAWHRVPSPNPGSIDNILYSVATTSPTNAWAVGYYSNPNRNMTLVERWNGTAWKHVASPSPGVYSSDFNDVVATSPTNAWAVGSFDTQTGYKTLIAQWNGTAWNQVPSPSPGSFDYLSAVSASSSSDAWAVGAASSYAMFIHWDGTAWTQVPTPTPPGDAGPFGFSDVAAISPTDVWAVGGYYNETLLQNQSLIVHWDGTGWTQVPSLNPGSATSTAGAFTNLEGVTATSSSDVWAVGNFYDGNGAATLTLHWC